MSVATRLFVPDPKRGWRRLSLLKACSAYNNQTPIPEYSNQAITIAFAHVEVIQRRVVKLLDIDYDLWRFDSQGVFDVNYWAERQHRRYWPVSMADITESNVNAAGAIQSICRNLGVPVLSLES